MPAMIPLAAALALSTLESSFERSLAWADRWCRQVNERSLNLSHSEASSARDAYDEVVRKYGPTWQTSLRIARCFVQEGKYEMAARTYACLDPVRVPPSELADAKLRAGLASQLETRAEPGFAVGHLARIPATDGWWAAAWVQEEFEAGGRVKGLPSWRWFDAMKLQLVKVNPATKKILVRKPMVSPGIGDFTMISEVMVHGITLDGDSEPAVLLDVHFLSADSCRSLLVAYRFEGDRLVKFQTFRGEEWVTVHRPAMSGPIVVGCAPTWRIWWPDYYEYRPSGFVFANFKYPALYRLRLNDIVGPAASPDDCFEWELDAAATYMCVGNPGAAYRSLQRAEKLCLPFGTGKQEYIGFYGAPQRHLAQIRQRMAWIRRGDLGHMLLYRPYDRDLQVPRNRIASFAP